MISNTIQSKIIMQLRTILLFLLVFFVEKTHAQVKIFTTDITNFYVAFDSLQRTNDTTQQKFFLDKYYFSKASDGLKKFIEFDVRDNQKLSSSTLLKHILAHKDIYVSKRPSIEGCLKQQLIIERKLTIYKKLYPEFVDGNIYFIIGRENIGGKPYGKDLLIGAELMASENPEWAVPMVLHEYTHTQQWLFRNIEKIFSKQPVQLTQILANAIWEGSADFISELTYGKPLEQFYPNHYNEFGYKYEKEIWQKFKEEMFSPLSDNKQWFYSEKDFNSKKVRDIGYFMGNQICKSYYKNAQDKQKAIADIINLPLDSDEVALKFLFDSGYATKEEINELEKRFKVSK